MSDFFGKRASSSDGRFFRDMPGRDEGNFWKKSSAMTAPTQSKPQASAPTQAPSQPASGSAFRGEGASGGMYGTGDGAKLASASPSDWDADDGDIAVGLHRPAREQPEALEDGGERFFSSEARLPSHGGGAIRHGLLETGGMAVGSLDGHQLGKHASDMRFMGTSYGHSKAAADFSDRASHLASKAGDYSGKAGDYASRHGKRFKKSLTTLADKTGKSIDEGVSSISGSPVAAGVAALLAARMGLGGVRALGRGGARLFRGKQPVPPTLMARAANKIKSMF